MKLPLIILSYGNFEDYKKLFSYEEDGVHILPLFTNADSAQKFIIRMTKTLRDFGDNRTLVPQLCSHAQHAYSMLVTISALMPDLTTVTFDPNSSESSSYRIDEVIKQLHDELGPSESPKHK